MLKQQLSQKLIQKLSPQQIQLMKLLQIPTAVLDQRIQEEMEQNPALEEGNEADEQLENYTDPQESAPEESGSEESEFIETEPFESQSEDSFEEYLNNYMDDEPSSYQYKTGEYGEDANSKSMPFAVESSFHDNLNKQIGTFLP